MNLNEFTRLQKAEQMEIIWQNGVPVGERGNQHHLYVLYCVFDFYFEAKHKLGYSEVVGSKAFKDGELLDHYLDKIDISNLNK